VNCHAACPSAVDQALRVPEITVVCPDIYDTRHKGKKTRKKRKSPFDYIHNSIPFRTGALCRFVIIWEKAAERPGMMI
jgi:hypothetical protein